MGASFIDYLLADRFVVPDDLYCAYTEKIVRLPGSYQINDASRAIAEATPTRAQAGLPERGFVFCCFNNNYKITPDVFESWMRLLAQIDNSVLWLLEGNADAPAHLRAEAERAGIAPARLIFAPRTRIEDHLARHRLADLFLDTHYYNAHTTASDALWAGVPVVTCAGATFASRVAGSLLTAVNLPELITVSLDDYERLALRLARAPALLAHYRQRLVENKTTQALFDTAGTTRGLEAAYTTMWRRWQRGEPADSFDVED
jgi:predicted O-linked N-acetylglucosamine transferase (SPINDLY family)